jgi:hypothetical protein
MKKLLVITALIALFLGIGCSSNPTVPNEGAKDLNTFFNSFDLSNPAVGQFTYTDYDGNVLATGTLGRSDDDSFYVIENRGVQADWFVDPDFTPLGLLICYVTYNNPAGTIPSGPNAGLPYYYIHQTVDYDINILSLFNQQIGVLNPPFGYSGPAELDATMHYAAFDSDGKVIAGGIMPGVPLYEWSGIISPGYQVLNDTYYIPTGTSPGLNVTKCRVTAPVFFGLIEVIFYDGVAGIWDPQ